MAQTVKNLPAMQETQVQSLGREDPLEKGMATHSSILPWRIPWTEEPGRLQSTELQPVSHDRVINPFRKDKLMEGSSSGMGTCFSASLTFQCSLGPLELSLTDPDWQHYSGILPGLWPQKDLLPLSHTAQRKGQRLSIAGEVVGGEKTAFEAKNIWSSSPESLCSQARKLPGFIPGAMKCEGRTQARHECA